MAGKKSGSGGTGVQWQPTSYEDAKKYVDMVRGRTGALGQQLAMYLPQMIRQVQAMTGHAGLSCPAPTSDAGGEYRVGLDANGEPEIQRRDPDANVWGPAPEILGAVQRRRLRLEEALDSLKQALMVGGVPEDARALVQIAHDRIVDVLGN